MSTAAVETTAESGVPAEAAAAAEAANGAPANGESAADILERLDRLGDGEVPERPATAKVADKKTDEVEAAPEDEDAKTIREINARSLARRKARGASRPALASVPAATPAVAAAAEAAKVADAAAAKPAPAAAAPSNEVAAAVRDVLLQIERLAGDDEKAATAAAAGTPDKGAEERTAALKTIQETVAKLADGLKETDALKGKLDALQAKLEAQQDEQYARQTIADQIDTIAEQVPTVASTKRHEIQIEQNGVKRNVRMTGTEIVHYQAIRFFDKYKVVPDMKELAKRVEKKLAGESPETNGEKTTTTRKTVTTSHSSPPAARQGPDKRSAKDAERDFYTRLGMKDEAERIS